MKAVAAVLWCCLAALPARAAEPGGGQEEYRLFSGYYKNFFMVFTPPAALSPTGSGAFGADSNRLRLKFAQSAGDALQFNAAYSVSGRIQDPVLFSSQNAFSVVGGVQSPLYRVTDLPAALYGPEGNVAVYQNLDRAYVKLAAGAADLYAGRQVVAWGSAKAVNPTDVIAPFRFDELDREERAGVDAVRLRLATGALAELDAGAVFGRDFLARESAFFLRDRLTLRNADVSLLLLDFRRNLLAGIDVAGALGGAGAWCEAAFVFAGLFSDYAREKDNNYLRLSAGADYNFSGGVYGYLEYHYNGAGAGAPADYIANAVGPAYADGAVYLLGVHYLIPGISVQITPLVTVYGQSVVNLADGSFYLSPQLEYNLCQNIYLSAGVLAGAGAGPERAAAGPLLRSEFGSYATSYFTSLRWYF